MPKKTSLLILCLLLTSCATSGRGIEVPPTVIDTGCDWTRPIYVSKADVLTEGTATQVLAHNETWQKRCEKNPTTGGAR